jgi:hypothetical protein
MAPAKRDRLEQAVLAVDADRLRGQVAVRFVAGAISAPFAPAVAVLWWLAMLWPLCRYVAREWRLGALMADDDRRARELRRLPGRDLRSAPGA